MSLRIQEPDLLRSYSKELGIRDRFGTPTLDDTLYSVVIAKNLTEPDQYLHATERLCSGGIFVSPVGVGFTGGLILVNPAGSGTLARILQVEFGPVENAGASANTWQLFFTTSTGTGTDRFLLNTHAFATTERPALRLDMVTVATPTSIGRIFTSSSLSEPKTVDMPKGFILAPNTSLCIAPVSTALDFTARFMWVERALQLGR